jgi:hypothetical protein
VKVGRKALRRSNYVNKERKESKKGTYERKKETYEGRKDGSIYMDIYIYTYIFVCVCMCGVATL